MAGVPTVDFLRRAGVALVVMAHAAACGRSPLLEAPTGGGGITDAGRSGDGAGGRPVGPGGATAGPDGGVAGRDARGSSPSPSPSPGVVQCGMSTCEATAQCCLTFAGQGLTPVCLPRGTPCPGAIIGCDNRADCPGGLYCCAGIGGGSTGPGTSCTEANRCRNLGQVIVCKTGGDCPPGGSNCCPLGAGGMFRFCSPLRC